VTAVVDTIYSVLPISGAILFLLTILVIAPLAFVPTTRKIAGKALIVISYGFGIILWIGSAITVYVICGVGALLVGLLLLGLGPIPMALLIHLLHRNWSNFADILSVIFLWAVTRFGGIYALSKSRARHAPADHATVIL
jgi:hypothetical protein